MRILFYCSEYPPYKSGGIGRVTKIVAEELVKCGHIVHVIGYYSSMRTNYEHSVDNGVEIFRYKLDSVIDSMPFLFRCVRKLGLARHLAQRQIDFIEDKIQEHISNYKMEVLELTDFYPFILYARNLKFRKFSIPTVLRVHGSSSFVQSLSGKGRKYYFENDTRHFRRCDCISAVSSYSLQYVISNYKLPCSIRKEVIYNPIDDRFLCKSPSTNNDYILFVGKLIKTKGCYSLAKAFNTLASDCPTVKLVFAGDGNIDALLNVIEPKYHNRVVFHGYCDTATLTKIIDECAFACIPSYFENFSMVALEIMARQKALIFTTRTSGREIISQGCNGFVVDPDDLSDLSTKMRLLVNDHKLRDSLAFNAYQTIDCKFKSSIIVRQLESLYMSLLNV